MLFSAFAVVSATGYEAGWQHGHSGVDRPGGDFNVTQSALPAGCFAMCMADERCRSWTHFADTVTCHLKDQVPAQALVADRTCASGVKAAAAQGLLPLKFKNFKLGSIAPAGWLQKQLVLMTNGQAGHLELFWDDIQDSVWVGGEHDHSGAGHERGPYWLCLDITSQDISHQLSGSFAGHTFPKLAAQNQLASDEARRLSGGGQERRLFLYLLRPRRRHDHLHEQLDSPARPTSRGRRQPSASVPPRKRAATAPSCYPLQHWLQWGCLDVQHQQQEGRRCRGGRRRRRARPERQRGDRICDLRAVDLTRRAGRSRVGSRCQLIVDC